MLTAAFKSSMMSVGVSSLSTRVSIFQVQTVSYQWKQVQSLAHAPSDRAARTLSRRDQRVATAKPILKQLPPPFTRYGNVITDPMSGMKLPFLPSPIPPFSEKVAAPFVQKYIPPKADEEDEDEEKGRRVFWGIRFEAESPRSFLRRILTYPDWKTHIANPNYRG